MRVFTLNLLLLATALPAQAVSFNRGCGPVATWPRLRLTAGNAKINTRITITGSLLAPSQTSLTAIGLSNTSYMGLKLPFMIDPNVRPPCQLLVGPLVVLSGRTSNFGMQAWTFGIPNDTNLIGKKIYFQMATTTGALHMTDGLEITIS